MNPVRHFLIKSMPFSVFQLPYHAQITQNEYFFKASIHYIYVALNEESGQAKYSNVDLEKTNKQRMDVATVHPCLYTCAKCLECLHCKSAKEGQNPSPGFLL